MRNWQMAGVPVFEVLCSARQGQVLNLPLPVGMGEIEGDAGSIDW